jgi:uncharacterized protein YebE (UPF0316 family)
MSDFLADFPAVLLYLIIFFVKIIEVAMATVRIVMITKGEKIKGSIIGFFEVFIWVILTATVLVDITKDPFKIIVYALAFAFGNYFGSIFETRLGIGTVKIEAVIPKTKGKEISNALRDRGFGVTALDAYGRDERREILYMHVPRKKMEATVKLIKSFEGNMMITINETKPVYGGHGILRK